MTRKVFTGVMFVLVWMVGTTEAFCEEQGVSPYVSKGRFLMTGMIAPVGLPGTAYYAMAEHFVMDNITLGVAGGTYSHEEPYYTLTIGITEWEALGTLGYHVALPEVPRLTLFGNAYLGYASVNASASIDQATLALFDTDGWIEGFSAGARYFVSPNLGVFAAAGIGIADVYFGASLFF